MAHNDYKKTLTLPRTDFPMKANLPEREPQMLRRWQESGLYRELLRQRAAAPGWVLHDGPPYANGRVHFGTALNKILKDFIVRSRAMMGLRTPYVPGWDCHGMPIEHQVVRELGAKARSMTKVELRRRCRAWAERWIEVQRQEFQRLGVLGDWENPYLTLSFDYEAAEIRILKQLLEQGFIYRALMPVYWCIDCRTALAEAEVEYRERNSPSIYVAFPFDASGAEQTALAARPEEAAVLEEARRQGRLFAVIWTTTPWTLPANLGVCLNPGLEYVVLESGERWYMVAAVLADAFAAVCGLTIARRVAVAEAALKALDGKSVLCHPFVERKVPVMFAEHVTADSGTGLVHTAPGHGHEDFIVGKAYGLSVLTPVDGAGSFTAEAGKYAGLNVFAANEVIVGDLSRLGRLLSHTSVTHAYPHCWRCKNPLIFRATEQWFMRVDHDGLRRRALDEINRRVKWIPPWARERIANMVAARPDWCLSRQRTWGVPIPALRCLQCRRVALFPEVIDRVEALFAREGSDVWYQRPVADFSGEALSCPQCGGAAFAKEEDVLDVWFDSGCSHEAVLGGRAELSWPADAYVEGIDQTRGWFQSSLMVAAASRGQAPYRCVVSHGLALDEVGRKMSKSLGNLEYAADVVGRMGADVLRLVFASVDYAGDMNVGETLFGMVSEAYRRLRNTFRYMLANLYDFDPAQDALPPAGMLEFDRFMLVQLERLKAEARRAYERFDFKAVYHAALNFVVGDLSSLFIDVARDRLYCAAKASPERRSAQTVLCRALDTLVRMLAPLIPFTAEEVYSHVPGRQAASVHFLEFAAEAPEVADSVLEMRWRQLLALRADALKVLEAMRQAGAIGASLEAVLELGTTAEDGSAARLLDGRLEAFRELCVVSGVAMMPAAQTADFAGRLDGRSETAGDGFFARPSQAAPEFLIVGRRAPGRKCPRCWVYFEAPEAEQLCPRCRRVLASAA